MKITVKAKTSVKYPYIGHYLQCTNGVEKTVWFTEPGRGIVIQSTQDYDTEGEYKDFDESVFVRFEGEVILSNN